MRKTKNWYTMETATPTEEEKGRSATAFKCMKFPPDQSRILENYRITRYSEYTICTCFAGNIKCRHQRMLEIPKFVGSGRFYDYDNQRWDGEGGVAP